MTMTVNGTLLLVHVAAGLLFVLSTFTTTAFLHPPSFIHTRANNNLRKSECIRVNEKPNWLDDAMDGFHLKQDDNEGVRLSKVLPLSTGIAGFTIDSELGFCAILAKNDKFVPVVVSPTDKDRLVSAEALTMVQLAGGLDLGTAILPPDSLAQLVVDELDDDDESTVQTLRPLISLSQVTVIPNIDGNANDVNERSMAQATAAVTSPERDAAIQEALPNVWAAVKGLAGLEQVTSDLVAMSMQRFANVQGQVDRQAFSSILDDLRSQQSPKAQSTVQFVLLVNVIRGDSITQVPVLTTDAVQAFGLAMRYKIAVEIDDEVLLWQQNEINDANSILERFPAFRPTLELQEDAKIMNGFVPGMFGRAQIDNDQKQ
jgi:hypothetical protein